MHLENPKEYLTLVKGEADNFSEVYGFRYESGFVTLSMFIASKIKE